MSGLAASIGSAEYEALRAQPRRWEPILSAIAEMHGLGRATLRAAPVGSNLVAMLGDDLVIKLFPPFLRHQYESERLALRHLRGRVTTAIPETFVDGEAGQWPYLIMSRLEGVPLSTIWDDCDPDEKGAILFAVGRLIATVQALPAGPLMALKPEWREFMAGQAERCRSRHARLGLAPHFLEQIDPYLEKTRQALAADSHPVILTGEYTPDNLLMRRRGGAWEIAGLVDFGDAMVGFAEYDLLGPGTFLAAGNATHVRALLAGFGYDGPVATRGLSGRLMRMLLLHRHSNLSVQLKIEGWQDRVRSLDELERLLWPLDDPG